MQRINGTFVRVSRERAILEGLSSITGEMTKLPLYGRFLEGSGMQFLEHLMVDTIEPTVHGTLAESDTEDVDI